MCVANAQLHRYEYLVNRTAGIVFISTPHLGSNKLETLEKALLMLKATTKPTVKLPPARMEKEAAILFDLSLRFDEVHLRAPILSAFEMIPTKIHDGRFKSRKVIIIDGATCITQASDERCLPLPLDHVGISHLAACNEDCKQPIKEFFSTAIDDAQQALPGKLEAVEMRHWDTATYSPTYSETSSISFERIREGTRSLCCCPLITLLKGRIENQAARHDSTDTTVVTNDATYASSQPGLENLSHVVSNLNIRQREPIIPCRLLETEYHNDEFFGRENVIEVIERALLPPKDKAISAETEGLRQFALCGMGGMGKTEIANEFTFRNKEAFDAVFWMRADETAKLGEESILLSQLPTGRCYLYTYTRCGLQSCFLGARLGGPVREQEPRRQQRAREGMAVETVENDLHRGKSYTNHRHLADNL